MTRHRLAAALLAAGLLAPLSGSPAAEHTAAPRPRIGLVLSGGGARGAAHIGVLKVLEALRIPIDLVVGTSMGALVGGGYAAGLSPQELERRVTRADWDDLFVDDPPRKDWPARRKEQSAHPTLDFTIGVRRGQLKLPEGAIAGQKVQLFFNDLVKNVETIQRFDDLPIPFRAVATDLENGQLKVFDRGPLPVAMRASMSVPTLFAPVDWEGRVYVDGGLVRNLPVDVARGLGADIIIAVNLGSGYLPRDQFGDIVGVFDQMIAILTEQNVQRSLRELDRQRDVLIAPTLGNITSDEFARAAEAIATGVTATRLAAPQLARYRLSEAHYAAWKRAHSGTPRAVRPVAQVRITGLELVNPGVFGGLVAAQQGRPLDRARLTEEIAKVYGRNDFERISYRFQPAQSGGDLLIVDAIEKAWGPGYLRFGLGLSEDNKGDGLFGVHGRYNQTWVDRLGAEWSTGITLGNAPRLSTEFYQPLSLERMAFVAPYLDLSLSPESVFLGNRRVARYDVTRGRIGADLGTTLHGVQVRAGPYVGQTLVSLDTGSPELPEGRVTDTGVAGRLLYDTLDSVAVPRSGTRLALDVRNPITAMGADVQYTRALIDADAAYSTGSNTVSLRLRAGSGFGRRLPYYDQFPLGGFLNLSGYANNQFRGNDMAFGALIYHRRIASLPAPLGRGLYLGASLEAGWLAAGDVSNPATGERIILNPAATSVGGSLFFGSDTWLGPAYLGWGLSGSGDNTVYLLIGRP